MECGAYKQEIDFARSQGDFESAREILDIMRKEKRTILGQGEAVEVLR